MRYNDKYKLDSDEIRSTYIEIPSTETQCIRLSVQVKYM